MSVLTPTISDDVDVNATIITIARTIQDAQHGGAAPPGQLSPEDSARVASELALRNCALNAVTAGIAVIDSRTPGKPYVFVNKAFAALYGCTREELLGRPFALLPLAPSSDEQRERLRAAVEADQELRIDLQMQREDGSLYWMGMSLAPVRNAGQQVTHFVLIGADITAKVEAERRKQELQEQLYAEMKERERISLELRLAQKLEAVGRLAAGVAHEINTPIQYVGDSVYFLRSAMADVEALLQRYREAFVALTHGASFEAVSGALQEAESHLDMEYLTAEVPKAFERTLEGVERVGNIVRAMKEFAHPDGSEQSPNDLNHALQTTLTVARNEYKYFAEVHTQFADLPHVVCNVGELNQVFLNLIVNAAHAIESAHRDPGTGRIDISTALCGDRVQVRIRDNGCGIPPENLEHIFDPFFTTKEVGKGTGQGLAIARSIVVDKHVGDIAVHSTPNVGTEFIIELPIAGRPAQDAAS